MLRTSRTLIAILLAIGGQASAGALTSRIENTNMAFSVAENGSWEVLDKSTNEVWRSSADMPRFAMVTVRNGTSTAVLPVTSFSKVCSDSGVLTLDWRTDRPQAVAVRFTARLLPDGKGVEVSWKQIGGAWRVTGVRFPDSSFRSTKAESGYLVVPNRMGIIVPAGEKSAETRTYPTYRSYGGCSMAMAGAVKNGSALLMSWEDPNCVLETKRGDDLSYVEMSVLSNGPSGYVAIRPVGPGGYVEIAKAYREVAAERRLLVTWKDKFPSGRNPTAGAAFLAAGNLMYIDGKKFVCWSFEDCAVGAEHYKKDLGIDKGMYCLRGFNHRGYDCQYPDLLPAAPECGGDPGLIDCGNRIRALGYLFGLHDNYQDIWPDSPSWDPDLVMRNPDGSLQLSWMGATGQSYRINSRKGFELAQRSQNIPEVNRRYDPTFYYIDTTCAAPLYEDFSRDHPLTFRGDMYWKQRLCRYARETFGVFGTEEGVEWAVPYSDYFWSLVTRTKQILPSFNEVPVPLFEMVYGDCVDMHQGDWSMINTPHKVLDHILCAELPYCVASKFDSSKPWCSIASVTRSGADSISVSCEWKTYGARPAGNYGVAIWFAEPGYTDSETVVFAQTHPFAVPTSQWPVNGSYVDGPFTIGGPELKAPAEGEKLYDVYVVMTSNPDGTGEGIGIRGIYLSVSTGWPGSVECYIGRVKLASDGNVSVGDPVLPDFCCFARCDTRPDCSYQNDGLLLNTYKICSPLNQITANTPMTGHKFLTADRLVERSEFSDVAITVNYGAAPYNTGNAVLPQYGFLVQSPRMVAFRATSYAGRPFSEPTLAVLTTSDGEPLATSAAANTYRAYGDRRVTVAGREFSLD